MTSILNTIIAAAEANPSAECFVVSEVSWTALERDCQDGYAWLHREGLVSTVEGLKQMTIMGVPISRVRAGFLKDTPFIEMHHRPDGITPVFWRIL